MTNLSYIISGIIIIGLAALGLIIGSIFSDEAILAISGLLVGAVLGAIITALLPKR